MGDVAAAVGVSKTTISRYLHGEYGYMSDETKARIEAAIKELGYRPNRMAQGLKSTVSNMVGVTIADIGNPFSSQMLKGIQQELRARDIQLLVSDSNNDPAIERANIEALLDAQVDGLIVNTVGGNDAYLTAYCTGGEPKPMVMLDRFVRPLVCDCVATNNHEATVEMLDHVAAQGFSHVVFVTRSDRGVSTRSIRREAVERYLAGRGTSGGGASADGVLGDGTSGDVSLDEGALSGEVLVYDGGVDDLRARLAAVVGERGVGRVCLFANNEESMRDVMEAMSELDGERGHVGVCAFADERWARYSGEGITCLDQQPVLMGRTVAKALLARTYDGGDDEASVAEAIAVDGVVVAARNDGHLLCEVPAQLHIHASTRL
ncbi:LacI family DNA-binding transcriptional regulator [Bifidobacterium eulemuris]|nr:LacI family DNA-binding transcriptional regulator [Bifidobacterium eulemuris]